VSHIKSKVQKCQQKSHHRPIPYAPLTPKQCATNYEWIRKSSSTIPTIINPTNFN